jgi:competence protein ComEA
MDHVVPDWHAFGAEPAVTERSAAAVAVPLWKTPRILVLGGTAVLVVVASLIAFAWLLMPSGGGVTIDPGAGSTGQMAADGRTTATGPHPADGTGFSVVDAAAGGLLATALTVDVEGAVQRPGLVHVAVGDRIGDAIRIAGGFSPRADLRAASSDLNLAQALTDGLKVVVPEIGSSTAAAEASPAGKGATGGNGSTSATGTSRVELNTASQAELEALPGIGPVTAGHILEARAQQRFVSVDDLRSRSLVGASTFDKLKGLVTVAP